MLGKPDTLGNAEIGFIHAVALETLAAMLADKRVLKSVGEGGRLPITPKQIAASLGYKKLSTYHHRLLNQLAQNGWLEVEWIERNRKVYYMGYQAWRKIGFAALGDAAKKEWDQRMNTPIDIAILEGTNKESETNG